MLEFKKTPNILVVGDLMIDNYVWGNCERISPEAPVQILRVVKEDNRLGGACNVANNLIALGANAAICGIIGDDNDGKMLLGLLDCAKIDNKFVKIESKFSTIKKSRFLASNQQVLRVDREFGSCALREDSIFLIKKHISNFDCIILSDYGKGALDLTFCQDLIKLARESKIPILCDPKGDDYSKYKNATLITPNKKEAQIAIKSKIFDNESLQKCGFKLKNDLGLDSVIITLSEDGIAIFEDKFKRIPTLAREVFDVTGAGDTVISALGFCLANGMNLESSARFANAAAAVVVGKIGSAVANLGEVLGLMKNDINRGDIALIYALQKSGKKIVFSNGCFDILHVGHIEYLKQAKALGDILVIGLNSDSSIKKLKGPSRPINNQIDREKLLIALGCVDFVIVFDEETPQNLIEKIKPDILVKGGDYKIENIIGREFAKEVKVLDFIPNKSTTNIIKKIKGDSYE